MNKLLFALAVFSLVAGRLEATPAPVAKVAKVAPALTGGDDDDKGGDDDSDDDDEDFRLS